MVRNIYNYQCKEVLIMPKKHVVLAQTDQYNFMVSIKTLAKFINNMDKETEDKLSN